MNSQFNAIDYAQQLEAAGVPQVQAEVHARTLSHALSTFVASKADLAALEEKLTVRLDIFEARILARIEGFEARVERELAAMRVELAEMRAEISVLRGEMKYHRRLTNLVLALQVALLVKMFFP